MPPVLASPPIPPFGLSIFFAGLAEAFTLAWFRISLFVGASASLESVLAFSFAHDLKPDRVLLAGVGTGNVDAILGWGSGVS